MYDREEASASELIGFILLVGLFVVVAGYVGVMLYSGMDDDLTPALIIRSSAVNESGQNTLVLTHEGGDLLTKDKLEIYVAGEKMTDQFKDQSGSVDWDSWENGNELYLDVDVIPDDILVVSYENYNEPTIIYLLGEGTGAPIEVSTTIATPVPTDVPGDPPEAQFSATPLSGGFPLVVNFTDSSTNEPTSWLWDFGDGTTSTEQNPVHIYSSFGTFTVTLTATNEFGNGTITKTDYIEVLPSQTCDETGLTGYYYASNDFTGDPVTRTDQVIRFADQAAIDDDRYNYDSDIADWPNPIIGRDEQFSVIYEGYLLIDKEADYTFYLTSDDGSRLWIDNTGDGDSPVVDNWDDHSPEEKSNTIHLTEGFHPLKIKMYEKTGHAVLQLEWSSPDFPRGFITGDSLCVDECCKPLNAAFAADPESGVAPLNVSFTDTSTGSVAGWFWNFGDGTTSTEQNPVHIFTDPDSYSVNLTVTDVYGESDSYSKDIIVDESGLCTRPGLTGYYYDDRNFGGIPVERSDEIIRFADSGGVSGGYATDIDNWPEDIVGKTEQFGVIYEGYLMIEDAGDYTFYLTSDDGSYLWIDNIDDADTPLIDNWGYHSPQEKFATTYLTAGCHPVKVKMFENNGKAVLHLEWSSGDIARTYDIPFCRDDVCQAGPEPAAWWKFDEGSGDKAVDSSGNDNDGVIQGTYSRVAGACGDGLYFDGVTTYVTVPDSATLDTTDEVTLCAWIYPELPINKSGNTEEYRNFVSILDKGNRNFDNYEFFMQKKEDVSRLTFESDDRLDHLYGVPYEYNRWQHLACVVDTSAGTGTVYIDGAGVGTFEAPDSLVPNDEPVYIGMQKISGNYPDWATFNFKGKLDEVMLYTTALTAGQVQDIYGKCTPPPAPVAGFSADQMTGSAPLTVNFNDLSTNSPTSWQWDFGDGETSTEQNPSHIYISDGVYNVSLRAGNAGGYDSEIKTSYITVTGLPSPVGWWKFDEGSGGTAIDSSGNDNDGSIKGTYSRVSGACGDGLYFDGTSTYVLVPNDDTLDAPKYLSYAAWLKPEPPVIPDNMDVNKFLNFTSLICKGSQDEDNYELFIKNLNGGTELSFETESGGYKEYSATGFEYEFSRWQHVAFVADTDTGVAKLYINGEPAATVTSSLPDSFDTNNDALTIGMQQMYSPYLFRYKGVMDEVMLYTIALTDDQVREIYGTCTPSPTPDAPAADFTADTTGGDTPLTVTFTDSSTNSATSWLWNFGDGETSTEQNPEHTYEDSGTYSVTLTATNAGGSNTVTKTDFIDVSGVEISDFARFVMNENVFVYGQRFVFEGDDVNGPDATIVITGDILTGDDLNDGASVSVSDIYIEGSVDMDSGGADLGSQSSPGMININGDLNLRGGGRHIYGDVYVNGDSALKDATFHGNVYIDGNLELIVNGPDIAEGVYIYYTGSITHPDWYSQATLAKFIHQDTVPSAVMPDYEIPPVKSDEWYEDHGYISGGDMINNLRIFADSYSSNSWNGNADNVIIVAKNGDINLNGRGNAEATGLLFAPNGKVTFWGQSFEGVVISEGGFFVTKGGTDITFRNINNYIGNFEDYPF